MTTNLRPYVVTATRLGDDWPVRAARCRADHDKCLRVVDSTLVVDELRDVTLNRVLVAKFGADPVERALSRATCATIYIRSTGSRTYVLALVRPWEGDEYAAEPSEVYYGSADGFGHDQLAAAAAGIPVGTAFAPDGRRHRVILTDHSGLQGVDHPWQVEGPKAFLVHQSGCLPRGLFVH